ncbi:uncharacterized protein [Spinacia oleracea]|uniref:Kinesin-like protein n=1 Tax=Spinacia oleracea TaxID=3562 RepID=A0ABM3QW32_SPIOL|nr:uncharacterized protein LOC130462742 [Spinacia oleracea]
MTSPTGDKFEYAIRFTFSALNNEAEYEAAIAGVQLCLLADAKRIVMTTDSQLVANQFSGEYETKEPSMRRYQEKLKALTARLEAFEIKLVPGALKTAADSLAKLASSKAVELSRSVMIEIMHRRSTEDKGKEVMVITANKEWCDNIWTYKTTRMLPADIKEAKKIKKDVCCVVTIHVQGKDLKSGATSHGSLHLVDLAGSERVDRSEATGDRLREKNPHVPYRNSKLTQVLQASLGGQAKTLMFVQVNHDVSSYSESLSTLKFAERVSSVELGAARSSKEGRDVRELMDQFHS